MGEAAWINDLYEDLKRRYGAQQFLEEAGGISQFFFCVVRKQSAASCLRNSSPFFFISCFLVYEEQ